MVSVAFEGSRSVMSERSRSVRAFEGLLVGALLAFCPSGCAFVPKTRLDDAQKLVQGLRSENAQIKDSNLGLKVQNQDLTQRAVDDAQSIRALETANSQYERSIQGYQDEREQLRSAFNDLKEKIRASANR